MSAPSSPRSPTKKSIGSAAASSQPSVPTAPAHNVFPFDNNIIFSSNFDNGNLGRVERVPNRPYEFKVWTAPDNMGTEFQSKHCAWFHFSVVGLPMGCVLRIQLVNASNHSGLYKHDMRPVYRSSSTNQKWVRIRSSVRFIKESDNAQLYFEHSIDADNDKIYFAFTYPYSYTQMQTELNNYDIHQNRMDAAGSIFYTRELLTQSCDGRRLDLLTITSVDGADLSEREPLLPGLFPDTLSAAKSQRPPIFPNKEVIIVSARVHPGEVPAQHTFKGVLSLLMDPEDQTARELRAKYVFKLIPMLNPDGVYRGHFRMDQHGHNLNRYYNNPDPNLQPTIFAAKSLLDYYSQTGRLSVYLDMHAHASKRGCFIYGNVLDQLEDQIQNQLYCKLISMNSPHFDYEGCLFSREHMFRIDPGDQAKGLTAEGSGRVHTYLAYGLVHSYTLECNYNTSRIGNEVAVPEQEIAGQNVTPASPFTTNPEKYTPSSWAGVGRACIVAMLDIRGQNPCSRIPKSKFKTLDRVRNAVVMEVRNRKEYQGKQMSRERRRSMADKKLAGTSATQSDEFVWRRVVDGYEVQTSGTRSGATSARSSSTSLTLAAAAAAAMEQQARIAAETSNQESAGSYLFIPAGKDKRRKTISNAPSFASNNGSASSTASAAASSSADSSNNSYAPKSLRPKIDLSAASAGVAGIAVEADIITPGLVSTNSTAAGSQKVRKAIIPTPSVPASGLIEINTKISTTMNQQLRGNDETTGRNSEVRNQTTDSTSPKERYHHLERLILESQSARMSGHKTLSPPQAKEAASIAAKNETFESESLSGSASEQHLLHSSPSKILHGPLIGNTTKQMQQYFQSLNLHAALPPAASANETSSNSHNNSSSNNNSSTNNHTQQSAPKSSRPRSADAMKSVNAARRERQLASQINSHVTVEVLVPDMDKAVKDSPQRIGIHYSGQQSQNNHDSSNSASSSPPPGVGGTGIAGESRSSKSSDSSRLGVGASIRDLIREQSIQKLIKLSSHQQAAQALTGNNPSGSSAGVNVTANNPVPSSSSVANHGVNAPAPVPTGGSTSSVRRGSTNPNGLSTAQSPVVSKDNRKILGKTLHAAGVALLMNNSPSLAGGALDNHVATDGNNSNGNNLLSVQGMSASSRNSSSVNIHSSGNYNGSDMHIPVPIPHHR